MTRIHFCAGRWAALALLSITLCGCGGSDRPPLGTVHGKVTLDRQPLPGAGVGFKLRTGGREAYAATDADGNYELTYIRNDRGAPVGAHDVRISTANENTSKVEKVPAKYNSQTTLTAEVKPGDNEINFDLTTN